MVRKRSPVRVWLGAPACPAGEVVITPFSRRHAGVRIPYPEVSDFGSAVFLCTFDKENPILIRSGKEKQKRILATTNTFRTIPKGFVMCEKNKDPVTKTGWRLLTKKGQRSEERRVGKA